MEMCTYENNGDDFPNGVKLQIQKIDTTQNMITFVVPRIAGYLNKTNPLYPKYTTIDNANYAFFGPIPSGDGGGGYFAFANRYVNPPDTIVLKNGEFLCGTSTNCGKQYRLNYPDEKGKIRDAYVTSIHVKGIRGAMDGGVLTTYPLYDCTENCDEKNINISGSEWKIKVTIGKNANNEDVLQAIMFVRNN